MKTHKIIHSEILKTNIYRVAIVDINYNVNYYIPTFFSTKEKAIKAIERAINGESMRGWEKKDWNRHRWQTCESKDEGTRCIEMVKIAELRDETFGGYSYKGYGFITYNLD